MKWPVTIFSTLLLSFFCSLSLSSSTYALSDISVTYTAGTEISASTPFIPTSTCSASCLQDYNYIIFDFSDNQNVLYNSQVNIRVPYILGNSRSSVTVNLNYNDTIFAIHGNKDIESSPYSNPNTSITLLSDLTVTYTESLASCPVCPEPEEPEPCPVIPDNPYDTKLDNIVQAIYVCGAILLVIYFFYCIYRMIIHTTGGV